MKILNFRAENIKRLSVVEITPEGHLVQITGPNEQGKSSVLDAIEMALGGKKSVPSRPIHAGKKNAMTRLKLGDGTDVKLIVTRTFTESGDYLKVTSADGMRPNSPQEMLDALWKGIGFDPLEFMRLDARKQFEMLRTIVKLEVDIDALSAKRQEIFDARADLNRALKTARAVANGVVVADDLPDQPPDTKAILDRLAGVDQHNADIRSRAHKREGLCARLTTQQERVAEIERQMEALSHQLVEASAIARDIQGTVDSFAANPLPELQDAGALRAELEAANAIVAACERREVKISADAEVTTLERSAEEASAAIDAIDAQKKAALAGAKMPIDGLSFTDGIVTFNGLPLAQASSAQQLRISAAIGAALNPKLRVLLARDGSLLDTKSMTALGEFAKEHDMQIWIERVDESGEVGVVMVDGHVKGQEELVAAFEKEEAAAAAAKPEDAKPAGEQPEPTGERLERAKAFLATVRGSLTAAEKRADADMLDARAKIALKNFPSLHTEWMTAHAARIEQLPK